MFRWDKVLPRTVNGITMKFYRDKFVPSSIVTTNLMNRELDDVAFNELGQEVMMYKVMDTNFVALMEERFDLERVKKVDIPNG